jgi:hypothetical protein
MINRCLQQLLGLTCIRIFAYLVFYLKFTQLQQVKNTMLQKLKTLKIIHLAICGGVLLA